MVLSAIGLHPTVRTAAELLNHKEKENNMTIKSNVKAGGVKANHNQAAR